MSKIAEALAKAKERTGHTTAPFMSGAPVAPVVAPEKKVAALRRARRVQRFWLTLSSIALVLTVVIIWMRLDETKGTAAAAGSNAAEAAAGGGRHATPAAAVGPSKVELANEVPVAVVLPTETGAPANGAATTGAPVPSVELQAAVNALSFTAVMPGERPRLMYKGRIVGVGERVEGELVFAGIHDGRLVFNDTKGAIYLRRY